MASKKETTELAIAAGYFIARGSLGLRRGSERGIKCGPLVAPTRLSGI